MKNMLGLLFVVVVALFGQSTLADEQVMSTIKGADKATQIDLKAYDHAFAGSIKDFLVWGALDESTGVSELRMRRDAQTVVAEFKKDASGLGGTISSTTEDGLKTTKIEFVGLDKDTATYTLKVNGNEMMVKVVPENFKDDHFINPTYTATLNGQTITYKFEGSACYNYSLHLAFMICGAYFH